MASIFKAQSKIFLVAHLGFIKLLDIMAMHLHIQQVVDHGQIEFRTPFFILIRIEFFIRVITSQRPQGNISSFVISVPF